MLFDVWRAIEVGLGVFGWASFQLTQTGPPKVMKNIYQRSLSPLGERMGEGVRTLYQEIA